MRQVRLHVFASAKGGVGKSTLAVLAAEVLASRGRLVHMWDADFTGTSLADGLLLEAPVVTAQEDGSMALWSPPTERWIGPMTAWHQRSDRKLAAPDDRAHAPPYLNDLFSYAGGSGPAAEVCVQALGWRLQGGRARYYPSSSLEADVATALGWVSAPLNAARWAVRMAQLLHAACAQQGDLTDVVVDLPPGLHGFGLFALHLAGALMNRWPLGDASDPPDWGALGLSWSINPFLVTTDDRNALLATIEGYLAMRGRLPELKLVVNRNDRGVQAALDDIRRYHPHLPLEGALHRVEEHRDTLGRLFRTGRLELNDDLVDAAWQQLRLGGVA